MNFNLNIHQKSQKALKESNDKFAEFEQACTDSSNSIRNKFFDLERDLQDRKHKELTKVSKRLEKKRLQVKKANEKNVTSSKELFRILEFMHIIEGGEKLLTPNIYTYGRTEVENKQVTAEPIDTLISNKYLKLEFYIDESYRRPKNKYALMVIGNSLFGSTLLDNTPTSYGDELRFWSTNVSSTIKSFPSIEELKTYLSNSKHRILKDFLKEHKKAELEFEKVRENTDTKEWRIAYLEKRKRYFEISVSRGTEDKKYLEIVEELKTLRGEN